MRTATTILTACLVALICGCDNGYAPKPSLADRVNMLTAEKADLQNRLLKATEENEQLKKRVEALAALPEGVKGENLYRIENIKISGYTDFYDKDKDGIKETLIVYIKPIDDRGDTLKAPGAVDVQLWNLNKEPENALIAEWRIEPAELKELWFATLLASNYRLSFDVAGKVRDFAEPLTVKVAFTDPLTGRVLNKQHMIKP
ncbi:MAG: hypothetical protein JSU94_21845 [Phycisphaerales bacterium]|nr:MAG: hypothetical protein JSU94_21845 [Phycisphaerales bacterium]